MGLVVMGDLVSTFSHCWACRRDGLLGSHLSQCCGCGSVGPAGSVPVPAGSWQLDVISKPCAAACRLCWLCPKAAAPCNRWPEGQMAQGVNKSCGLGDITKHLTFDLAVYFVISAWRLIYGIINLCLSPFLWPWRCLHHGPCF